MPRYKEIYTTAELAKKFQVTEATVRRMVRENRLFPIIGLKQPYRFTDKEVRRFLYGEQETVSR